MASIPDPGSKGICISYKETQGDGKYKSGFFSENRKTMQAGLRSTGYGTNTAVILAFTQ